MALLFVNADVVMAEVATKDDVVVESLIRDLSAPKFVTRQRAMSQLVAIGADAIPGLNAAIRGGDRETRFRAGRVLDAVEQNVFQQKLEQFIKAGVGDLHVNLPSWKTFCGKIPESAESRRVFALISRAEPRLCRAIEHGAAQASKEIDRRCAEIQVLLRENRMATISQGTITGLLFASGIDDLKMNRYSVKTIFSLCNQAAFSNQLRVRSSTGVYTYPTTPTANIMRELFAGCLMHCESWDAQMAFSLAMSFNIPQCLPRALELVRDKQTPCHVMQTVMIAIAMFGDKTAIPVLELRVDDNSFCGVTQRVNNVQYQTQLRDVAIAAMLILAKENPKLYGFPRIQVYASGQFSYSHVGFANDDSRIKTRAKWDTFRATLKVPRIDEE
ncbi:MAG: hypothetical protein HOB73_16470 [Planctomycetaceae bacterium]|jgi:hypothetical protein|nr:hypothetical protein [Planctomycetaceae bacterium]